MKMKSSRWWFAIFAIVAAFSSPHAEAAQKDLLKLTVGYTPISGATLPFFIAVEEKLFQKHSFEVSPVFMGGSPLINSASFRSAIRAAARLSRAASPAAT